MLQLIIYLCCVLGVGENCGAGDYNVFYTLHTRSEQQEKFQCTDLNYISLDGAKPTVLMIHGWTENATVSYCLEMAREFLKKYDCNFITVDWSSVSSQNYIAAFNLVKTIGETIGKFLMRLHTFKNIPYSKMHVIGHSLGGHIAGFVGKTVASFTGEHLDRITALDPAGPLFTNPSNRLNKSDAKTVLVIHTDGKMFGYFDPLGTVDLYPNGGVGFQTGCFTLDVVLMQNLWCSHQKSRSYFVESVNHAKYWATKCDSWNNYKMGRCDGNEKIKFSDDTFVDARGSYYFATND